MMDVPIDFRMEVLGALKEIASWFNKKPEELRVVNCQELSDEDKDYFINPEAADWSEFRTIGVEIYNNVPRLLYAVVKRGGMQPECIVMGVWE